MLKRIVAPLVITLLSPSLTWAYNFYVAPSLVYQGISAGNVDYMGLVLRPAVGVGGPFRNSLVYVGGELFGNLKSVTFHNHRASTSGLKPQYSVGASFTPGYIFDEELLGFARLGVIYTEFDNLNVTRRGLQAGVGLQANVLGCWSLRAEYIYTNYRSITGIGSPRADEWGAGVVYTFA